MTPRQRERISRANELRRNARRNGTSMRRRSGAGGSGG